MKRFYCTICKRIKRVRKYPLNIQNVNDTMPENRQGICNRHMARVFQTDQKYSKTGVR